MRLALTMCQRATPSAVAQPTHEPVFSWLLIVHHAPRRSTEAGKAAGAPMVPAWIESISCQSFSVPLEGTTLQMNESNLVDLCLPLAFLAELRFFAGAFVAGALFADAFDAAFFAALFVAMSFSSASDLQGRQRCAS